MKFQFIVLIAAGLAIMLGCVGTTSVEAPGTVNPVCTFQVIVNTLLIDSCSLPECGGLLAILIPMEWSIDSVYATGYGYSGPMLLDSVGTWPTNIYPPSTGYEWVDFVTPDNTLYGSIGDTGHATVTIMTGDSLGTFSLAFLAAEFNPPGDLHWVGDPCNCTVEVTPLNLQEETWGHIKSEF